MSRRGRQSLSPSLFPFLAVLVCTLGTLILLLALVSQNATEAAEQQARAEQQAKAKQLAKKKPESTRMTATAAESMLAEERFRVEQLVAFRDKQTADLGDRRDQLTHLEDHMKRLREKLQRLNEEVNLATSETPPDDIDEQAVARVRAEIESQRAAIEELRQRSDSGSPRVVIVPHKGPNGTDRRPVYLECTAQELIVWPEGSRITLDQLDEASHSANPLDAALRIVRLHVMQNYGDSAPPYPLLVVRPDGIETYAAARHAMRDWDDQFGYELVPADVQLAYARPDDTLKARIDVAIREAAVRQHARHAIARRAGMLGDRLHGSHLDRSAMSPTARGADLAGGSNARRGERLPTLSAASLDRDGRSSGYRSHREDYSNLASQYTSAPYTSQSQSRARASYGDDHSSLRYQAAAEAAEARRITDEMRAAAREMRETSSFANEFATGDQLASGATPDQQADIGQDAGAASASASNQAATGNRITDTSSNSQTATGTGGSQASPSPSMQPATATNGQPATPTSAAATTAPRTDLVQPGGRDWALPQSLAGARGNAIVRTIRLECHADRFVLLSSKAALATEVFGFSSGTDIRRASLELATAVRDRIERWGPALPGGRWQPRLDVLVMPEGEIRFHELRSLMNGSGIEVTGRVAP